MIKIFIEGKENSVPESSFLCAILSHIGVPSDRYDIVHTGGFTNLVDSDKMPNVEIMRANSDEEGINLVIFDSDTKANNGGFEDRRDYLIKRRNEHGLDFELFLWPDNASDGDVEMLMESIARKDLYPEFFECFSKYEHCMSQRKNGSGAPFYRTPNRKGKLHTYFNALPISNRKKSKFGSGQWLWSDPLIWNLDSDALKPVKDFLSKYLLNG